MKIKTVKIINKLGLHARAATKLVNLASRYACEIKIIKDDKVVNAKSIMGVMMLAASKGMDLTFTCSGDDEDDAMNALLDLIENRFGEAE